MLNSQQQASYSHYCAHYLHLHDKSAATQLIIAYSTVQGLSFTTILTLCVSRRQSPSVWLSDKKRNFSMQAVIRYASFNLACWRRNNPEIMEMYQTQIYISTKKIMDQRSE